MTLPSIRVRLARALVGWSLVWGAAVSIAVGLAVQHEVDELLDDTLQASAEVLGALLADSDSATAVAPRERVARGQLAPSERFAWQVVGPGQRVMLHSPQAPETPFRATPSAGFSHAPAWRIFGMPLDSDGRMLYVAQTRAERTEAKAEVALGSALAALAVGLLGHVWLRARVRHELKPLQDLSDRLVDYNPLDIDATLGPAMREELKPVHAAIDALGRRLARRLAQEQAFTAHAAHSLRTPLAGLDAQLAVALRECPPSVQPRLQRAREAAGRLQHVVSALLALFRSGVELQRQPVDLESLLSRLPVEGLTVQVQAGANIDADPDLLAAALLNLLDNALRHGAKHVEVSVPQAQRVRLHDDGAGITPDQRGRLQQALDQQDYEGRTGLGLMLANLVALSHGGTLTLPDARKGFAAELFLGSGLDSA